MERIEPDHMRKVPPYHLDPFKAGLFVAMPVIDVPIHGKELIGSHMGIPNHNDFIFALDVMKDRFRRNPIGPGAAGVMKEILIPAVMEIVGLKILEMMAFVKCLKKTCTKGHISIHGASAVHEKQQFGLVLAGLFHDNFQLTALFRRCGNGLLHIQFRSWSLFPIGEASQPAQGNLELADPKHMIITEITE